jgi:thymidine kinase
MAFDAVPIQFAADILLHLEPDTTVVGVDEAQFFDENVISVVQELADRKMRVLVAGLDLDFRAEPFGSMPILMAMAEKVDKLEANCMVCVPGCDPHPAPGQRQSGLL